MPHFSKYGSFHTENLFSVNIGSFFEETTEYLEKSVWEWILKHMYMCTVAGFSSNFKNGSADAFTSELDCCQGLW